MKIALDPFHAGRTGLLPAGQGPEFRALLRSRFAQGAADETGRTGDGDGHSSTNWSRWITAARGA